MKIFRLVVTPVVAALIVGACADRTSTFHVGYAPGYVQGPMRASLLGVYREGRFDPDGLRVLGPEVTQKAFHADVCPVGFDAERRSASPVLFDAVDGAAKTDGITEPLLAALAPAAVGDVIVFVTVAGQVRTARDAGAMLAPTASNTGGGAGGLGRGQGRPGGAAGVGGRMMSVPQDENALQIEATIYSTKDKRTVAQVAETYTGSSEAEAMAAFRDKLAATFPGATCAGWKDDAWPTEAALKSLPAEP